MQTQPVKKVKIGIFGTWGFGNMGDAAVAGATIDGLKRQFPDAEFLAICQQPENKVIRHDIPSISMFRTYISNADLVYEENESAGADGAGRESAVDKAVGLIKRVRPLFWALKGAQRALQFVYLVYKEALFTVTIFRSVRGLDLLAMAGSGQLNEEWGGPWRYPFHLFRWCLAARLSGCKVAFLSVGMGELTSFWTRFFCTNAVRLAHYRSMRDTRAKETLEKWGVNDILLVPDMAFSMTFDDADAGAREGHPLVVGINPIPYADPRTWNIVDDREYESFISKLASIADEMIARGHRVSFVPNDVLMDNMAIDDIIAAMKPGNVTGQNVIRSSVDDHVDLVGALAACDYVICCRFHGLVFSVMSDKPIIALAHHYKFFKLAEEMGQQEYCREIDKFEVDDVLALFDKLVSNRDAVIGEIRSRRAAYAERVEEQYRRMVALVGP